MKVGDLVQCPGYGTGIVLRVEGHDITIHFSKVRKTETWDIDFLIRAGGKVVK